MKFNKASKKNEMTTSGKHLKYVEIH
jgi:hypothetical protein